MKGKLHLIFHCDDMQCHVMKKLKAEFYKGDFFVCYKEEVNPFRLSFCILHLSVWI